MHPDHLEPELLVGVVPADDVRQRTLAVDTRVRPEVDQHNLPLKAGDRQRPVARRVEPLLDALERRRLPAVLEHRRILFAAAQLLVLRGHDAAEVERLRHRIRLAQLRLQGIRVIRDETLQRLRNIEEQSESERQHHRTGGDPKPAFVPTKRLHPLGKPTTGKRKSEQRDGRANRERQRQDDRPHPNLARRTGDRDRRKHRTSTRHIDRAERDPEHKTTTVGADRRPRDERKRLLEHMLHPREDEPGADQDENDGAGPDQEILWEMQDGEQQRADQGERAEAHHEAEDDLVWPGVPHLLWGGIRPGDAHESRGLHTAGEEDHGQHGKNARRNAGDEAADDPNKCERKQHDGSNCSG